MADNVEVKVVADGGPAQSSLEQTARSIDASLQAMRSSLESFGAKNKVVVEQAVRNNADLSRSFLELKGSVSGGFNAIAGVIERFRGVIGTIGAALAGGMIGKEAIAAMIQLRDTVKGLETVFGTSAEKATLMAVQLKLAGVSADSFEAMAFKVGRTIHSNSGEFDRLKVTVKDSAGNLLPMDTILQNIYTRMLDFKEGTDQMEFALSTVGRSAKDFKADMESFNSTQARAIQLQKEMGIEMSDERQAQIKAYKIEMNAFKIVLESIGDRIGQALMPRLMGLAKFFNSEGPAAAEYIIVAFKSIITVITVVTSLLGSIATQAGITVAAVVEHFRILIDVVTLKINPIEGWRRMFANIRQYAQDSFTHTIEDAQSAARKINAIWSDSAAGAPASGKAPKRGGSERFTAAPSGGGGAAESQMAGWEAALAAEHDAYERMKLDQGSFEQWSEAQTSAYWQRILGAANMSDKEREQVLNRYYAAERKIRVEAFQSEIADLESQKAEYKYNIEARIGIAQKEYDMEVARYGAQSARAKMAYKQILEERQRLADQIVRIADIEQKSAEATAKHDYEMFKLNEDQQVALRVVTKSQSLAVERAYLQSSLAMERSAIEGRIAVMAADPNSDPVKLAELKSQLLNVDREYQTKLTQIDMEAERERLADAVAAADAVESSFATALSGIIGHTKSVSQAFRDMANSIMKSLTDIAAKQIAKSLLGAGTSAGGGLMSMFSSLFGGGGIPGFAVGTPYVPHDTIAMVHRGEAIIPAAQNKPGAMGHTFTINNQFMLAGRVDTRTQDQIAAHASIALQRAAQKIL